MMMMEAAGCTGARAVTSKEDVLGIEILHRNTKRVKFNRNKTISGKLSNREMVFDNIRGNKNIVKVKGAREGGVASTHDR
jgi:hypothetical protein